MNYMMDCEIKYRRYVVVDTASLPRFRLTGWIEGMLFFR